MSSFATLRALARRPPTAAEHCDLCAIGLASEHQHLIDPVARKLVCACDACAILFPPTGETKYKRVPRRARLLKNFQMTDAAWDSLLIPIGMAFFLKNSVENRVLALYPSPAGSTESLLPLEAWNEIVADNPVLARMEPDVEALLVNRLDRSRRQEASQYYVVPIDRCYELVGLIRTHWRGLSGGTAVWEEIGHFFDRLNEHAIGGGSGA